MAAVERQLAELKSMVLTLAEANVTPKQRRRLNRGDSSPVELRRATSGSQAKLLDRGSPRRERTGTKDKPSRSAVRRTRSGRGESHLDA